MRTTTIYKICNEIVALLEANRAALGVQKIYYGDQAKMFTKTTICVEPGTKKATLRSANRKTECVLDVSIFVYVGGLKEPVNYRKDVDELTDKIEEILNDSINLGGLVTHCYVQSISHGYSTKSDGIVKANEISLKVEYLEQLRNII